MTNSFQRGLNSIHFGSTIVDILDYCATNQPEAIAYEFCTGNKSKFKLTYRELNRQARAIASQLQEKNLQQQRVLLIYPHGLEFIAAFLGCLSAGAIAVPVYPPRRNQKLSRIQTIVEDCTASAVLTVTQLEAKIKAHFSEHTSLKYIFTDTIDINNQTPITIAKPTPEQTAFLQYTSGSTGSPKGVIITHKNIIDNSALIYRCFEHKSNSRVVSWLPFYHDMGLIGGILQPLYGGFPVILLSPTDFLRQPLLWLETITKYRATTSGAPNFAYKMCVDKITPEAKKKLDLSSWDLAFVGAEPIRVKTLEKFAEAFGECGFKKSAFYPCYGMAEATLMICGGVKSALPVVAENRNLSHHKTVVGCGKINRGQTVVIVDPNTYQPCNEGKIGEIWIRENDSIAKGYWDKEELTEDIFKAQLSNSNNFYLRTGDLGFIQQEELFVTGRIKDLIIIRGQNYYPQDLEKTVEQSHPALRINSGAAFSIEVEGKEQLVIVQEVKRTYIKKLNRRDVACNVSTACNIPTENPNNTPTEKNQTLKQEIEDAVRGAVSKEYGLNVYDIQLIKPGSIAKTSSGKIQRYRCREKYLIEVKIQETEFRRQNSELEHQKSSTQEPKNKVKESEKNNQTVSIINWLRDYAAENINSQIIDQRRCIPPSIVLDFGNQGLLGMQVPKEYGGLGLNNSQTMQIIEQLGAIDTTLCLFVGLNNILGIRPILKYGSEELKSQHLTSLATGRELAAFALTETAAGSNPQAIVSEAIPTGENSWNIQGEKIWSGSAAWASVTNVFVQHQDINGSYKGISAFAVRRGTPGLKQGKEALTMGMRGMVQNTVYFDDVAVTSQQLLGEAGKGMEVAQDAMMYGRLAIASACLGGMKRCAQLILRYASRRQVSTGRLLDNPVILTRLGGLTAKITAVECLVKQITQLLDQGEAIPVEAYTACKTSAPEFYWQAADDLVQFLGGRGYIETNLAPQILRDARILRIFEGPTETLKMFLGSRIVNQKDSISWIKNTWDAVEVYQQLLEAVEKIANRFKRNPIFNQSTDTRRWMYILVGEIATDAILLAATQYTQKQNPSKELERAVAWLELQLEEKIQNAVTMSPDESVTTSAATTQALIDSYQQTIGDIQQSLAGEDTESDPLLDHSDVACNIATEKSKQTISSVDSVNKTNSETIHQWLSQWLSKKLQIPSDKIDPTKAFADYGIDSVMAVELAQDLQEWLPNNLEIQPTLAWNFPNIETLVGYLVSLVDASDCHPYTQNHDTAYNPLEELKKSDIDSLSEEELARSLLEEISWAQAREIHE